jgi:hypothetical protein
MGSTGIAQEHIRLKQPPKQEAVELRFIFIAEQGVRIEQIAVANLEPQIPVREPFPPVKAKFVHVGDDRKTRLDRIVWKHTPASIP